MAAVARHFAFSCYLITHLSRSSFAIVYQLLCFVIQLSRLMLVDYITVSILQSNSLKGIGQV